MLASLKYELGDLGRVKAWIKVLGFAKCAEGFNLTPAAINGFSDLILALWGEDGRHAQSPSDPAIELSPKRSPGPLRRGMGSDRRGCSMLGDPKPRILTRDRLLRLAGGNRLGRRGSGR
jgi:hypothetical protein